MPRKRTSRLYRKGGRFYADFRDFRDVGGKQSPMIPPGTSGATDDPDVAQRLMLVELARLQGLRRQAVALSATDYRARLGPVVREFLAVEREAIDGDKPKALTRSWLRTMTGHLERAMDHFGEERPLDGIDPADVEAWLEWIRRTVKGRSGALSGDSLRHHMHSLSRVYGFARYKRYLPHDYNPVRALPARHKPQAARGEAFFLEVPDASALLEKCRSVASKRPDLACPFLFELVATYLLTGGRRSEVLGLEVGDIDFTRKLVHFRPNRWRRLKTPKSTRHVPLWPQLEAILRDYLNRRTTAEVMGQAPVCSLLFPGETRAGVPGMVRDFRKALALAVTGAEISGAVTPKAFRHTYCSARLQTTDKGAPVALDTVRREMGHGSTAMVERVYGHLGQFRHRGKVVEYRGAVPAGNKRSVTRKPAGVRKSLQRP